MLWVLLLQHVVIAKPSRSFARHALGWQRAELGGWIDNSGSDHNRPCF